MGNTIIKIDTSAMNNESENTCLICREKIQKSHLVTCSRCNIPLHYLCYEKYNKINKYTFKICPNCRRIGTLGQELYHKHVFEKTTTSSYL